MEDQCDKAARPNLNSKSNNESLNAALTLTLIQRDVRYFLNLKEPFCTLNFGNVEL